MAKSFASSFIDCGIECAGAVSLESRLRPDASFGLSDWAEDNSVEYFEIADVNGREFRLICEQAQPSLLLLEWSQILSKATIDMFP